MKFFKKNLCTAGTVDVAFINNSVCGLVIESAVELVVAAAAAAAAVVVVVGVVTVTEFMFAVDDNNVKVAFSVAVVVVVVVAVVVTFDDLGLFQSPKRVQAFFHLH
uniref:Uncharacterized protein n=1 Tax=Glossina palpalis gambiensis TaxID=67801 RepID=A0A1B0BHZ2_9MUSC